MTLCCCCHCSYHKLTLCIVSDAGYKQPQRSDGAEEEAQGFEDGARQRTQAAGAGTEGARETREAGDGQEEEVRLRKVAGQSVAGGRFDLVTVLAQFSS